MVSLTTLKPMTWTAEALQTFCHFHTLMRLDSHGRWALPVDPVDVLALSCIRLDPPGTYSRMSPLADYCVFLDTFTEHDLKEFAWELGRLRYHQEQLRAVTLETIVSFSFPTSVLAIPRRALAAE